MAWDYTLIGISISLEHRHFRVHKHERKMEYFYPWNLKFGTICYSKKHSQEKELESSECYKRPAGTVTGTSLIVALVANRPAQNLFWQEKPDLLNMLITNGPRTSLLKGKMHAAPQGKGEVMRHFLWAVHILMRY